MWVFERRPGEAMTMHGFIRLSNTRAKILLLAVLMASTPAHSHITLLDPKSRTLDAGLTELPCGGKPAGASVATYAAGSDVEITFNLSQQHTRTTKVFISFDNFASSQKLGMMPTPQYGVYQMTVTLPAQLQGEAIMQVTHQDYVSCADITLSEALPFSINAGINDAWFSPATTGQGFFIIVFPAIKMMFVAMFTYEVELPDSSVEAVLGAAEHRWFTALGSYDGDRAELNIDITSGGIFDSPVPEVGQVPDGTLTVEFANCHEGIVTYNIPSINREDSIPIQRLTNDNVALCNTLNTP